MIKLADEKACTGCTACKAICPQNAISMVVDNEGFLRPQIDSSKCIECHACENVCPVLHPGEKDENPICYAAKNKDEEIRLLSSSGGLFTAFARSVFAQGGVVFGCVLEKDTLVAIHTKAESEAELEAMRGSKYVQSDLRNTFKEVKEYLLKGRKVLFTGTPCQIAGLNKFIGNNENLYLVEVICYGTPSPAVFEKNKIEIEKQYKKNISRINFRKKDKSWHRCSISYVFNDNTEVKHLLCLDTYARSFFANLSLRPSCCQCIAKQGRSGADITIGDFWGIENVKSEFDDDKGTSVVLIHSGKGKSLFNDASLSLEFLPVSYNEATKGNPYYLTHVNPSKKRDWFMRNFRGEKLEKLLVYCVGGPFYVRCLRKLVNFVRKLKASFRSN
jgi:coenzyme F420-reducing hydrogenase beta subunit